jgi:hypothetical protein
VALQLLCKLRKLHLELRNLVPLPHTLDRKFEALPDWAVANVTQTYTLELLVQCLCHCGTFCSQTFQSLLVTFQWNAGGLCWEFQAVDESEKISISNFDIHNILYKVCISLSSSFSRNGKVRNLVLRFHRHPTLDDQQLRKQEIYIAEMNQITRCYYYYIKSRNGDKKKSLTSSSSFFRFVGFICCGCEFHSEIDERKDAANPTAVRGSMDIAETRLKFRHPK